MRATAIRDLPKADVRKERIREEQTAVPADNNPVDSVRTKADHSNPEVVRSSRDPVLPKKAARAITSPDKMTTAAATAIKARTRTAARAEIPDGLKTATINPVLLTGTTAAERTTEADSSRISHRARKSTTRRRKSSSAAR